MTNYKIKFLKYIFPVLLFSIFLQIEASETNGTIDLANHNALLCLNDICTTTSKINFLTTNGDSVLITDTSIVGHAWAETMGWINLSPTTSGVTNTENGELGGFAWGENAGWINFNPTNGGVTINNLGEFDGYAWSQNYGWIKFDCSVTDACVKTDWRPISARIIEGNGGGSGSYVTPPVQPEIPVIPEIPTLPITETVTPINPEEVIPVIPEIPEVQNEEPIISPVKESNSSGSIINRFDSGTRQLVEEFKNDFSFLEKFTRDLIKIIYQIFESPLGKTISKIIGAVGIATGLSVNMMNLLFANPLSFSEIILLPIRLWSLLLTALGIKKRNRPWGTVYDSVTKQPLDPVYVTLYDLNGKEISSCITDIDGRYGFLVPAGSYRMTANKTDYEFPSKKLIGKIKDEVYSELYFNEIIEVKDGEVISKNIPMDPINFNWNEFVKKEKKLTKFFSSRDVWLARFADALFVFGFMVSVVALFVSPVFYNIAIFALYIILLIFKNVVIKPKPFGIVKNKKTGEPLSFAILRIFFVNNDQEVSHKVTNKIGKYYCLIPNGTYYVKIENKNEDESYSLAHISDPLEVKKGYIGRRFEV